MIPSVVAHEVARALRDFLGTGFGPPNPPLAHVLDDFLAEQENLVKGPYLSIALPPKGGEPFPEVPLGFTPYRHQRIAHQRLDSGAAHGVSSGCKCLWRAPKEPPEKAQIALEVRKSELAPSYPQPPSTGSPQRGHDMVVTALPRSGRKAPLGHGELRVRPEAGTGRLSLRVRLPSQPRHEKHLTQRGDDAADDSRPRRRSWRRIDQGGPVELPVYGINNSISPPFNQRVAVLR